MDNTESARRNMLETGQPAKDLAEDNGPTWDTEEMQRDYEVVGFAAPFVVVVRRSDGVKGSLDFTTTHPRQYFDFVEAT